MGTSSISPSILPFILLVSLGILIFVQMFLDRALQKHWTEDPERSRESYFAACDFIKAQKRLEKWRAARPFLFVGQSAYARTLVWKMIETYSLLLTYGRVQDTEVLVGLYRLLNERPPSHDPPTNGKDRRRVVLFCPTII